MKIVPNVIYGAFKYFIAISPTMLQALNKAAAPKKNATNAMIVAKNPVTSFASTFQSTQQIWISMPRKNKNIKKPKIIGIAAKMNLIIMVTYV